jgi:hypothetical protein
MTQLGTMVAEDGSILFATDRLVIAHDLMMGGRGHLLDDGKGRTFPWATSLMWSWAGMETVGAPFEDWMNEANASSWDALRNGAAQELRKLNLVYMRSGQGIVITQCLIAGFIGGLPGILHIGGFGTTNWRPESTPKTDDQFVGRSRLGAAVAWDYVQQHYPADRTASHFCDLMRFVIARDPGLGGFAAWRIPSDGLPERLPSIDGD